MEGRRPDDFGLSTKAIVAEKSRMGSGGDAATPHDVLLSGNQAAAPQDALPAWRPSQEQQVQRQQNVQRAQQLPQQHQLQPQQLVLNGEKLPAHQVEEKAQVEFSRTPGSQVSGCMPLQQRPLEEQQRMLHTRAETPFGLQEGMQKQAQPEGMQKQAQSEGVQGLLVNPQDNLMHHHQMPDQQLQQPRKQHLMKVGLRNGQHPPSGGEQNLLQQQAQHQLLEQRLQPSISQQKGQQQPQQQLAAGLDAPLPAVFQLERQQDVHQPPPVQLLNGQHHQHPASTAPQKQGWMAPGQQAQQQVQQVLQHVHQQTEQQPPLRVAAPPIVSGVLEPQQTTRALATPQTSTPLSKLNIPLQGEVQQQPLQQHAIQWQQQHLKQPQVHELWPQSVQQQQLPQQQLQALQDSHKLQQQQQLSRPALSGQAPQALVQDPHGQQQQQEPLQVRAYETLAQQQQKPQQPMQQQRPPEVGLQQRQEQAQHQNQQMPVDGTQEPLRPQAGTTPAIDPSLAASATLPERSSSSEILISGGETSAALRGVSVFTGIPSPNSRTMQRQQRLRSARFSRADRTPAVGEEITKRAEATTRPDSTWVPPSGLSVQQPPSVPQQMPHEMKPQPVQQGGGDGAASHPRTYPAVTKLVGTGLQNRGLPCNSSGRQRSRGGGPQGAAGSGQAPRSSQREIAPPRNCSRLAEQAAAATSSRDTSGAPIYAHGSDENAKPLIADSGTPATLSTVTGGSGAARSLPERQQRREDGDAAGNGVAGNRIAAPVGVSAPAAAGVRSTRASRSVRVRTAFPIRRLSSPRKHPGENFGLGSLRPPRQPRSSSVTASVTLSEAAAVVARRASSAFALPPSGTSLPPELLSDLQQHATASSASHHAADEVAEQLKVLRRARTAKGFIPDQPRRGEETSQQRQRGLSSSAHRFATGGSRFDAGLTTRATSYTQRLPESSEDTEGASREWRASADTVPTLRHRPLLEHESSHSRISGARQRVFMSDSMGRSAEKERRWPGNRVARPLWHDVFSEETPRKLNLTSFVGETWTSRLKGKFIIVVRRLPFDIRTTSNCLAKLESLLLGQTDTLQSPASPSPVSTRREGSGSTVFDKGYWRTSTAAESPSPARTYQGPSLPAASGLASSKFRGGEEGLIGPSRSADDVCRMAAGGAPARAWGSAAEADGDTDSGRRDAFRLRSLALARELLRRVRSEMQLVPQRGKAIRNLLEAPVGPPSAARSDATLVQPTDIIPTNPADYSSPGTASTQRTDEPAEQSDLQQQTNSCSATRERKPDRMESLTTSSRAVPPSPADTGKGQQQATSADDDVYGSTADSREKSVSEGQTPRCCGTSGATGASATDGLVVLSGADIAWDIATTLKPYVPCITISDLGIDWDEMGLTGSEQQLMQQRVLDTVRRQHPSVHPISLGKEARRECYSEQILNTLFHCRTPPVGTGFSHLDWQGYVRMNEEFAKAVQQDYAEGDVVFIYDYHFMLLPLMLRQAIPKATIVVHWATVFPSSEMFRILPQREPLLSGLLGADLITFQAYAFHRQFANTCRMLRGTGALAGVRLAIVPRGLDPTPWLQQMRMQKSGGPSDWEELRKKLGGRTVFVGVDSISANSGIPHKMVAFRHFLQEHPEYINKVVFVQAAITDSTVRRVPSWQMLHEIHQKLLQTFASGASSRYSEQCHVIPPPLVQAPDTFLDQDPRQLLSEAECHELLSQVYHFVGCINSEFGAVASQAVHFLTVPWTAEGLSPLFACADVCLATSVRESFSWAAYAFILCQKFSNKGVLVLSEFSGSAQALGAGALIVNPWNARTFAGALLDALNMSEQERAERHAYAYRYCTKHSDKMWARQLLTELGTVLRTPSRDAHTSGDSSNPGSAASSAS